MTQENTPPPISPSTRLHAGRHRSDQLTWRVMIGPCLTRAQAAGRAGVDILEVQQRPDLLRLSGTWLQETYFAFQFDESGIRSDLGSVVQSLKGRFDDPEIADWLGRPNPLLESYSPLSWLGSGRTAARVDSAARDAGPFVQKDEHTAASEWLDPAQPITPPKPDDRTYRRAASRLAWGASRVGDVATEVT